MIYIVFSLLLICCVVYFFWMLETDIPSLDINENDKISSIIEWLNLLKKKKKFNGVIGFNNGGEDKIFSSGIKTFDSKEYIDKDTRFRLASISKQFTAFAIMILNKKHKLFYDQPVNEIIKDFPSSKVTIRHLLNQTSGIKVDYATLAKRKIRSKIYILTIKDATSLICQNTDNKMRPLVSFLYNNSNYILLARIIELISTQTYEAFMQKNVFEKLGLKNTFVWNLCSVEDISNKKNIATGFEAYLKSKPINVKPTWIDGVAGDGAIFSNVNDIIRWLRLWDNNSLLSQNELAIAFEKPKLLSGYLSSYGFGWAIEEDHVWHNGKWLANNAMVIKYHNGNNLIALDNSSNIRFNNILKSLREALFS